MLSLQYLQGNTIYNVKYDKKICVSVKLQSMYEYESITVGNTINHTRQPQKLQLVYEFYSIVRIIKNNLAISNKNE